MNSAAPSPVAVGADDVEAADVDAQWEAWMAGWEHFLTAALALPDTPDAPAPALPDNPIPVGPVPGWLGQRLLRAQAVKDAAVAAVAARLVAITPARSFTPPREPRPGGTIDL